MTDARVPAAALLVWFCVAALSAATASAQTPVQASVDSLRAELARLQVQLDSLRRIVGSGAAAPRADTAADPIAAVRAAAAAALAGDTAAADVAGVQEGEFVGRQRNLNVFNPEISVTGDIFAFVRSADVDEDNFVPREFEVALQSNLDPYSRAKVFVAHHRHGGEIEPFETHLEPGGDAEAEHGEEAETEIEEGYVEWVSLPGGLGLKVGKFRQRFGKLNRWHAHALPAQQLPLPFVAFVGEEGLAQTGAAVHWLLPLHGAGTYEVWTEVTRSDSEPVFGESRGVSVLGHVNAFWQLSSATYLELGASAIAGQYASETVETGFGGRVFGIDATYDWTPPARARYRQATLHAGVMLSRNPVQVAGEDARGAYAIGEFRFAQQWIAGARWEWVENPLDASERTWLASPSLTWWQSEYVRLRAAYEFVDRLGERFGQLVLQTTFAMGPHKHETY